MTRYALHRTTITDATEAARRCETVQRYMPSNYSAHVTMTSDGTYGIAIQGQDSAGWTLQDYVLPRLASGMYYASELVVPEW